MPQLISIAVEAPPGALHRDRFSGSGLERPSHHQIGWSYRDQVGTHPIRISAPQRTSKVVRPRRTGGGRRVMTHHAMIDQTEQ